MASRSPRLALRENLHLVDYGILGLAFTSLLVFLVHRTGALPGGEVLILLYVDLALVTLYGSAFATKWFLADQPVRWLRRNALNALGVLPLTVNVVPLLADRYFVVVQVLVVVLRAGEALDRAFGARVLQGLFERYRSMVVEELTDPLLMRLAIVLEEAVVGRDYAAAIGKRIEGRRDLMRAAVARGIAASPKLTRLYAFGPVQRKVDETTDELVDALSAALTSPEVNQIIREGLQDAFAELKDNIRERKWQEKGVGVRDIAVGVVASGGKPPSTPGGTEPPAPDVATRET